MEKAALDDPFLADALEGYAATGVNLQADLAELRERLAGKTNKDKLIPIAVPRSSIPWLKMAAMIVVVAGAGFLIYQLGFTNKKNNEIAQAPVAKKEAADQLSIKADSNLAATTTETKSIPQNNDRQERVTVAENQTSSPAIVPETNNSVASTPSLPARDSMTGEQVYQRKTVMQPADDRAEQKTTATVARPVQDEKQMALKEEAAGIAAQKKEKALDTKDREVGFLSRAQDKNAIEANRRQRNIFRGRITDGHNNALPFANVTNTADSVGTYSDANGYFVLTSPDSVLDVQVRSVGFQNNNIRLHNQAPPNQVIMQEDNSLSEVVVSSRRANNNRSRASNMVLEEPEPVDGWANYDLYIANNLHPPDKLKSQQTGGGEVQLSFAVDAKGQPVNITVDKSLCDSCDKEAIRLIKDGPKWKRKAKKRGRTSISIYF